MPAYVYLIEEEPHQGEWRMDANLKCGNPRNIRIAAAFEFETSGQAGIAEISAHKALVVASTKRGGFGFHGKKLLCGWKIKMRNSANNHNCTALELAMPNISVEQTVRKLCFWVSPHYGAVHLEQLGV